ncbi:hypothetical protein ARMGADRAFT_1012979 [Armillaria gallica]|uniref:Uncharacterized protein n=1 Tax=Armillaria gallica TaxID=47427 RepID=A0A2H3DY95_ARMGA|nr:hypothetical protein ARMGADRAFT_1012979 [Armillaria gallica]
MFDADGRTPPFPPKDVIWTSPMLCDVRLPRYPLLLACITKPALERVRKVNLRDWSVMRRRQREEREGMPGGGGNDPRFSLDQEWTNSYRMETTAKLKQVQDLSDPEHPRVFHVTRCSRCGGQLDLPSVHFMCNHSYHQREYSVIREIRRNNERLADQHELFLSEVKENGFKAVAEGFGRGALNLARVDEVAS